MSTQSPNTQLALIDSLTPIESNSDLQQAWHLLALLLSIGHPLSPQELAFRCSLFHITPDLIQFLCSIPNSPITLTATTEGILVTISVAGVFAFERFASNFEFIDKMLLENENDIKVYCRKRKRIAFETQEANKELPLKSVSKRIRCDSSKVDFYMSECISRRINVLPNFMSIKLNNIILPPNLCIETVGNKLTYQLKSVQKVEDEMDKGIVVSRETIMGPELDEESDSTKIVLDSEDFRREDKVKEVVVLDSEDDRREADVEMVDLNVDIDPAHCKDDVEKNAAVNMLCSNGGGDDCNAANDCIMGTVVSKEGELLIDSSDVKRKPESLGLASINLIDVPTESKDKRQSESTPLVEDQAAPTAMKQIVRPSTELESVGEKKLSRPSAKMKLIFGDSLSPKKQAVVQYVEGSKAVTTAKAKHQAKRSLTEISKGQKPKPKHDDMHIKESKKDPSSFTSMDQAQTKDLPHFESYIVEEEKGSGGYGIVYRARRKSDGTIVAIKCPHANAHKHHVSNEQRMLERFGGKNFVIKYEGCIKSGNSDCFVLEYVDHDRPEVLKKDIKISQLQWYGYCMFRALASLHKQGIIHRDVKPGNFLFSLKSAKGYLIDFNLAMDLRQKYGITNKFKTGNGTSINPVPNAKSPSQSRRFPSAVNQVARKGLKPTLELKNEKRRTTSRPKGDNDLNGWNIIRSQGADGSGITSAKDMTSTRTPSAERLREPLPSHGRKELLSLLQEAMHSPNCEASSVPSSMRKRVAAPPGQMDERLIYLTPMPLRSTGIIKDGKPKKEGPCVGTKGFRAPEVLFRSNHQGPKVDIWSAGVTLLYLMIGRTPFYGDPEQNIKDIAKLRGSEDMWEVSKLHDRESSFPMELYNTETLPSINLREWCKLNTKKRDFLDQIPSSLFDLVDKCLTVNPRLRISAEDALKHEFFASCHEDLRKQRNLRQVSRLDTGTSVSSQEQSIRNRGLPRSSSVQT